MTDRDNAIRVAVNAVAVALVAGFLLGAGVVLLALWEHLP